MRWIGRILGTLIVVGLLVFVGHLAYVYLFPHWAGIVFYSYLIFGGLLLGFGQLSLAKSLHAKGFREFFVDSLVKAAAEKSLLSTARNAAISILSFLGAIPIWPFGLVSYLKPEIKKTLGKGRTFVNTFAVQSIEHYAAMFSLLSIALIYAGEYAGLRGHGYGIRFALIITLSVAIRDTVYAIQPGGLPAKLRRVSASPYLLFLSIIFMDFLSLAGGFALVKAGSAHAVTLQSLLATGKELYQGKDLLEILYGHHLSLMELTIGSAGLVFYGALLGIVLHMKEFKRQDEDYLWLSQIYNALGDFNKAIKYNNQIKGRTPEVESVQLVSLLGVNQIDKARQKAAHLATNGMPPTLVMLETAALSPIPAQVTVSLFAKALEEKMPDVFLQDGGVVLTQSDPEIIGRLAPIIDPHKADYPLTYAQLLLDQGDPEAALRVLNTPMSGFAEIVRLIKRLTASITEKEDPQVFEQWAETSLAKIQDLILALTTPWEKLMALGQLNAALFIAEKLGQHKVQEISYLMDELKVQMANDPTLATSLKAMEIRFKDLHKEEIFDRVTQ